MTASNLPDMDELEIQRKRIAELEKANQECDEILECKQAEKALREDKNYLHLALEGAVVGMWIRGSDGSWLSTSQLNSLFGLSPDAPPMREDEFPAFIYPDDLPRLQKAWRDAIKEGSIYEQEYRVIWSDGSVHCLASKGRIYAETGVPRFLGVTFDITERKQIENDLKANKERLQDLLSSIQDVFFELDREWRFTYLNQHAAHNGNFEPGDLIGENILGKFPFIAGSKFEEVYRKVMDTRLPDKFESKSLIRNKWYEVSVYPSTAGISVFWRDIIERKRAEEALREAHEKLQIQSEELQASHEELQVRSEEL